MSSIFFIDDYVEMAMELKEKIDIKAGKKKDTEAA